MKALVILSLLPPLIVHAIQLHADRPSVLLLCVDDLWPELDCFRKSYIRSPHIDELAATGRAFYRHYVQAPTCGASRYAMLTETYGPARNEALFARVKQIIEHPDCVSNPQTDESAAAVSYQPDAKTIWTLTHR